MPEPIEMMEIHVYEKKGVTRPLYENDFHDDPHLNAAVNFILQNSMNLTRISRLEGIDGSKTTIMKTPKKLVIIKDEDKEDLEEFTNLASIIQNVPENKHLEKAVENALLAQSKTSRVNVSVKKDDIEKNLKNLFIDYFGRDSV